MVITLVIALTLVVAAGEIASRVYRTASPVQAVKDLFRDVARG